MTDPNATIDSIQRNTILDFVNFHGGSQHNKFGSSEAWGRKCDRVLQHQIDSDGQVRYLVSWIPTWEYARNISNFGQVISEYKLQ